MSRDNQRSIPLEEYDEDDSRYVQAEFERRYGHGTVVNLLTNKGYRERWRRERLERIAQIDADLESGRLARALQRETRAMVLNLDSDEELTRYQTELIGALRKLTAEEDTDMDLSNSTHQTNAASVPYVGTTQTWHEPVTITHEHDHGAHGHPDADDGIHSHRHSHDGDASHDHVHVHGDLVAGRVGQPGEMAGSTNTYGLLNSAEIGPVARMRLKREQQGAQERRR